MSPRSPSVFLHRGDLPPGLSFPAGVAIDADDLEELKPALLTRDELLAGLLKVALNVLRWSACVWAAVLQEAA